MLPAAARAALRRRRAVRRWKNRKQPDMTAAQPRGRTDRRAPVVAKDASSRYGWKAKRADPSSSSEASQTSCRQRAAWARDERGETCWWWWWAKGPGPPQVGEAESPRRRASARKLAVPMQTRTARRTMHRRRSCWMPGGAQAKVQRARVARSERGMEIAEIEVTALPRLPLFSCEIRRSNRISQTAPTGIEQAISAAEGRCGELKACWGGD